jgi:hypothetical protein
VKVRVLSWAPTALAHDSRCLVSWPVRETGMH